VSFGAIQSYRGWPVAAARSCAIVCAYYAAARLGLTMQVGHSNVTPVWPPSGIAVGALMLCGWRYWPALLAGAFVVNVTTGLAPLVAAGLAIGNTLEYVLAAEILRRAGFDRRIHAVRDVAVLAFVALGAPVVAATIGTASLAVGGVIPSGAVAFVWITYLIGDGVGILVILPPMLAWRPAEWRGFEWRSFESRVRLRESLVLAALVIGCSLLVFMGSIRAAYLMFPLAIWSAVRFGQRGATSTILVVSGIALWGTVAGTSPFAQLASADPVTDTQKFIAAYALTALALAAAIGGQRDAERAASEHAKRLVAANRELEAFTYTVAHDLRAPLRALDGFSEALREDLDGTLSVDARRSLDRISDNARLMGTLIDVLLNFSRLGTRKLKLRPVQPAAIARNAFDRVVAGASGRTIDLTIAEMPACSADAALLSSVYQNLLENAVKFSRDRDVTKIDVGWLPAREAPDVPVYYVRDNGAGFDMEYGDRLFGVFSRLHPVSAYPGTGAGLAIVKRIVSRHGGEVWAAAEVDRGATFFFQLQQPA